MNHKNLIPEKRLAQRAARQAISRWVFINATYIGLLAAISATLIGFTSKPADPFDSAQINTQVATANTQLSSVRMQVVLSQSRLQACRDISRAPDWSKLLRALSNSMEEDVVLNRVDCVNDPAEPATSWPIEFRISGVGRSQQSVTQFILRVEKLQFFNDVRLMQTSPQVFNGHDTTAFDLTCSLFKTEGGRK